MWFDCHTKSITISSSVYKTTPKYRTYSAQLRHIVIQPCRFSYFTTSWLFNVWNTNIVLIHHVYRTIRVCSILWRGFLCHHSFLFNVHILVLIWSNVRINSLKKDEFRVTSRPFLFLAVSIKPFLFVT